MIELTQFHEMFFDECEELLDRAELLLREYQPLASPGTLAELRRCAHSIKGGCATFGFTCMAGCAAELERALDPALDPALASGEQPDTSMLALCGESFKMLRELVACQRCGTEPDEKRVADLVARLAVLGTPSSVDKRGELEQGACYGFSFVVSRTVVGADLLIEDMFEQLERVGKVTARSRPAPEDRHARWHLQVETVPGVTQTEVCQIVARLADPESLQVELMDAATSAPAVISASSDETGSAESDVVTHPGGTCARAGADRAASSAARSAEHIEGRSQTIVRYLVFGVSGQRYAARADEIEQVRACANLQPLAGAAKGVLGVLEVRGEYVPVIDSRNCLGATAASPSSLTPVMMLRTEAGRVGVRVDEVGDIVELDASAIQAPHRLIANRGFVHIVGLARFQEQLLTVIDLISLVRSAGMTHSGTFAVA